MFSSSPSLPHPHLQPPHSPTKDQWSSQPVDPSDKEGGKGEKGEVGEGGGSTTAEEEGSPEKDLIGSRREDSC